MTEMEVEKQTTAIFQNDRANFANDELGGTL
jgi:hypothetical protein